MTELGPWEHEEGLDPWEEDGTCSFCGSIEPEKFLNMVRAGEIVTPTDKNYKAYIGKNQDKFYFKHLSSEQKDEFVKLYNNKTMKIWGYDDLGENDNGDFYVCPYFTRRNNEK